MSVRPLFFWSNSIIKKANRGRGRPPGPTKLTAEFTDLYCALLREGLHMDTSAYYAGVGPAQVFVWMRKGRCGECPLCFDFFIAVKKALAVAEVDLFRALKAEQSPYWQRLAWIKERRWPKHWARRDPPPPKPKEAAQLNPEELIRSLREKLGHHGNGTNGNHD